jgi:Ca2+-binding RTX toxin-like protein
MIAFSVVLFVNDLNNNVFGFDNSDDVINGQGGNDLLDGLSGNDLLRGGTGNNTLNGGAGDDTLRVDSSIGDNLLGGGHGNDFLDTFRQYYYYANRSPSYSIIGVSGNNTLNGGAGDDTLRVDSSIGDNLLDGGDGNDSLLTSFISDEKGNLITDSNGSNTLNGGTGDDILRGGGSTGNDLLSGGEGNDFLDISGFSKAEKYDTYILLSSGNNLLDGGAGDDILNAEYSSGNNLLYGGAGNDGLSASYDSRGNNLLDGGDGNDFLLALRASGNNTLNGGAGDDTLRVNSSTGDNLLNGGDGNDSFYIDTSFPDTIDSGLVTQIVDGGKGDDYLSVDNSNTITFNAITNIGVITASRYRVIYKNIERFNISGTYNDDYIVGSDGNDTLYTGYGGNDTIDGGKGDDLLRVDYSVYSNPTGAIITTIDATTNIGAITAGTNRVSYKNIERFNISGTQYDDYIVATDGSDTLSTGYGGNDTIDGGKGDDLLRVDYGSSTGGIITTIDATTNIGAITAGTNRVSYKNIERLDINGTAYDDYIVGNNGNDTLSTGYGGNDTIDGGKGDDLLRVDYSVYGSSTGGIITTIDATTNIGAITAGIGAITQGNNRVSYKNIERLDILGTHNDDYIVGSDGSDTLSGGFNGNDSLIGGDGTDTFVFSQGYNQGLDTIYDFNATNELIQVSAYYFGGGLSIGSLSGTQFTIGTSATTWSERFIYNSATGGLFFDSDGSASRFTQVQFAQLDAGLSLS